MDIDWDLFVSSFWPILSGAITGTIPLTLMSFTFGLFIALGVALMRLSKIRVVKAIGWFYVSVIRGTPLLVQLFFIFYALPNLGVLIDPWPSAVLAFSLNVGGYGAEVIRAAILSVPRGSGRPATRSAIRTRRRCGGSSFPRPPASRCRHCRTPSSRS